MSEPKFLNDARAAVAKAEAQVKTLELEQARADMNVKDYRTRLVALGLDPDSDLDRQLSIIEADTQAVLELVDGKLAELRASLVTA